MSSAIYTIKKRKVRLNQNIPMRTSSFKDTIMCHEAVLHKSKKLGGELPYIIHGGPWKTDQEVLYFSNACPN